MKSSATNLFVGFGISVTMTSFVGWIIVAIAGISNWLFEYMTGIPKGLLYTSCVLGFIGAIFFESAMAEKSKVAHGGFDWIVFVIADIFAAGLICWLLLTHCADWFIDGGVAWLKLGATFIGGLFVGFFFAAIGYYISTGGK